MRKLIFGLILLTLPSSAFASSASSTIENHVSANSSNGNSQVTSTTNITVETNGQTTYYSSNEPNQSVKVESNNGTGSITVNGKSVTGSPSSVNQAPHVSKPPTPTTNKHISNQVRINFIVNFFEKLHKLLLHFFGR